MTWLLVGTGGIIGATLRYAVSRWISERWVVSFPAATLLINLTGSLLLAILTRQLGIWLPGFQPGAMLLLGTGICGAYTTFSTLTYEFTILMREGRTRAAFTYLGLSLVLGLCVTALGLYGVTR